VTVGPRGVEQSIVEMTTRRDLSMEEVPIAEVAGLLTERITTER
jgi:hypothetical protein